MLARSNRLYRLAVLAVVIIVFSAGAWASAPKNIILFIGDGMGIGAVTAARCAVLSSGGKLTLDSMPYTGFSLTCPSAGLVTDSAAGGTALATGCKTNNGCIAVDPKGVRLRTILEIAASMGKSTGIITTDPVTGATPATFVSHVLSRGQMDDIAAQIAYSRVNIVLGGGKQNFVPNSDNEKGRSDGRDLLADMKKRGYDVVFTAAELGNASSDKIIGLFASGAMDEINPNPSQNDMASKAISTLNKNSKGFFIMCESTGADHGGHGNNPGMVVSGVKLLDAALNTALDFARKDGNTLIVVTADHETGGLSVTNADEQNPAFKASWGTNGHTANMVPIYAYGPGAEKFTGTHQNTDIPRIFAELWGRELNNK